MNQFLLQRPASADPSRSWSVFFGYVALTALACLLVAMVLTLASPSLKEFGQNLLFSECIGLSILVFSVLLGRLPPLQGWRHTPRFVVMAMAGMPLGYLAGYSLASYLLRGRLSVDVLGEDGLNAVVTTLLATGFVGYMLWMRGRIAVEAAARSEAQRLAAESQLRLLRAQLEPHMLFNTLANLRALVDEDPKLAQQMIDQLITYLRGALAGSRTESTTLRQEFAQLKAYLEIMSLRMGSRLSFGLDLPDPLQQVAVPPMMLQPLVENAIKHGLEPKIDGGRIEVAACATATGIEISVTDSGLGLPVDSPLLQAGAPPAAGTSFGLDHVRERLATVYGPAASLRLTPNPPQGVRATVSFPT